jgi:hypothetical protein
MNLWFCDLHTCVCVCKSCVCVCVCKSCVCVCVDVCAMTMRCLWQESTKFLLLHTPCLSRAEREWRQWTKLKAECMLRSSWLLSMEFENRGWLSMEFENLRRRKYQLLFTLLFPNYCYSRIIVIPELLLRGMETHLIWLNFGQNGSQGSEAIQPPADPRGAEARPKTGCLRSSPSWHVSKVFW